MARKKTSDFTERDIWLHHFPGRVKDKPECFLCWRTKKQGRLERHHVKPIYKGGKDKLRNLVLLCYDCHKIVPDCAMVTWEWLRRARDGWADQNSITWIAVSEWMANKLRAAKERGIVSEQWVDSLMKWAMHRMGKHWMNPYHGAYEVDRRIYRMEWALKNRAGAE